MISICKMFSFEAAHNLPDHQGKCHNLHGHSFRLEVEISGQMQISGPSIGMIMDFSDLKKIVEDKILNYVDHTNLNEQYPLPTAENMVEHFSYILDLVLPIDVVLERVRLYETANSYAEWRKI